VRILTLTFLSLLIPVCAFSQAGNGTITGTITDPTGASIAGAAIEVKNADTGVVTPTVSTATGAYTASNLPPAGYSVAVTAPGFKKFTRTGLNLSAAQVLGIDVTLEVGANTDSVTVSAEASLLKTESGDVVQNITVEQLQDLPVLGIGGANAGSSGVRNPFNSTVLIPGVVYNPNFTMIVNGAPGNTAAYRVEGLDNTNHTVSYALQENQPSADAIQEVAIQTSNYAAEFGQAGGGLFNITMKSGSNQYHGSIYEYFVNEDLNAAYPFSIDADGNKIRPRNRRNDFGGTVGGPIWIPKVYNGHNKSFFFFSLEEFREASGFTPSDTLPTNAFRAGDFSAISPNGGANFNPTLGVPSTPVGTDLLGRPIFANEIYDPATRAVDPATGLAYANAFPNNVVPASRITAYAQGVQKLIPAVTNGNYTNNYTGYNLAARVSKIPSLKIDQSVGSKGKISFYWSTTGTDAQYSTPNGNADGLPDIISANRGTFIHALTERLNYDYTLTPTLLLHLGAGYSRISFLDTSAYTKGGGKFDCTSISLVGCEASYNFPTVTSLVPTTSASTLGGMQQLGNSTLHTQTYTERPSYNTNMTWVHSNHTFKFGGEVWLQGNITQPPSGVSLSFGANATAEPINVSTGGQQMGFQYASFLLGDASSLTQIAPIDARMGKSQWAFFAQDSWKVSRKLTLDYGLRWDYATSAREQYGRSASLGLTTPNPAAGGHLGAPIFEATCNCSFVSNYPYAFGPRLGVAYQLDSKTVLRGGWGFVYAFAPDLSQSSSSNLLSTPVGTNAFANVMTAGSLPQPVWPNFSPGQSPLPGQTTGFTGLSLIDPHASRPPRQDQWSIGLQREVTRDFVVEASFVGNVGVWWTGPYGYLNQVSPATFKQFGLDPYNNPADAALITQPLSSPAVIAKVGNYLPYAGYSTANTLYNALRPFPQFSTIVDTNSPTGKTWYDSLQVKATKRMSHGLQVNGAFTWSKALTEIAPENFFSPSSSLKSIQSTDQPFLLTMNILYQTQTYFKNSILATVTKDWQLGAFMQYGSGLPLTPPASTNATPGGIISSEMVRTGQPLFLKDLNCGCINPYFDQVLNPAAWANPAANTFGPGPTPGLSAGLYYSDFRQARRPLENFNIGRNFRINKGEHAVTLSVRAEFSNIFNRTQIGNPVTSNPLGALTRDAQGRITGGFGGINDVVALGSTPSTTSNGVVGQLYQQPRQGTIVARITF
jgi:hypothetical protein